MFEIMLHFWICDFYEPSTETCYARTLSRYCCFFLEEYPSHITDVEFLMLLHIQFFSSHRAGSALFQNLDLPSSFSLAGCGTRHRLSWRSIHCLIGPSDPNESSTFSPTLQSLWWWPVILACHILWACCRFDPTILSASPLHSKGAESSNLSLWLSAGFENCMIHPLGAHTP